MPKDQIGVLIDEELKKKIEGQLGYNDSMSGWVREAIHEKLEREGLMEEEEGKAKTEVAPPTPR